MANFTDDEDFLFSEDEDEVSTLDTQKYKILIVDDEPAVHDMTSLALKNIEFKNKGLELLHAYSAEEAKDVLTTNTDIAVIFLDVIMETDTAGLDLVKVIREDLKNNMVRIILRTGQPGLAPEEEVIVNYDINDYKDKTELTIQKLFSSLISALRSYSDLIKIQKNKNGLEKVLKSTSFMVKVKFIHEFFDGLLEQVISLVSENDSSISNDINSIIIFYKNNVCNKTIGTGKYCDEEETKLAIENIYHKEIDKVLLSSSVTRENEYLILHKHNPDNKAILLIVEGNISSVDVDNDLLEIFLDNAANIYDHLLAADIKE